MTKRTPKQLAKTEENEPTPEAPVQNQTPPYLPMVQSISLVHILTVLLIIAAFLLGSFYTKVQELEKGTKTSGAAQTAQAAGTQAQAAPSTAPQKVTVDNGHFPIKGDKGAKVQIVEFADLRCPFCQQFFTNVEPQIMKDYVDTGKATFAFRHYAFLGPASTVAANAAECANDQGKFWEMHDYFYKNQPSESDTSLYTNDKLTEIAGTLGMDTTQFASCMQANKFDKNVTDDTQAGQTAGVSGTPTTFINGTPIVGAVPYDQVKQAIDAELAK